MGTNEQAMEAAYIALGKLKLPSEEDLRLIETKPSVEWLQGRIAILQEENSKLRAALTFIRDEIGDSCTNLIAWEALR